jgi:hypothetical protein
VIKENIKLKNQDSGKPENNLQRELIFQGGGSLGAYESGDFKAI